jgi:hypothetical protein
MSSFLSVEAPYLGIAQSSANTHRFDTNKLRNAKMFEDFEGKIRRNVANDVEGSPGILLW